LTQKKIAFDEKVARRNEILTKSLKTWKIPETGSTVTEAGTLNNLNICINKLKYLV
jgi:hypothetical protein